MTPRTQRRCWLAAILLLIAALYLWIAAGAGWLPASFAVLIPPSMASADRAADARDRVEPELRQALAGQGLGWGAPALLRIYKQESELELWLAGDDGRYRLFRTWPICRWSGDLGPKLVEGDGQAPEGVYHVDAAAMNPRSRFHLSFNLGFPNAFDQAHGRTGSFLMVHGNCVSIGCYAMGDAAIEQIYTLVAAAQDGGQRRVPVMAFPFRFVDGWRDERSGHRWLDFWDQLAAIDEAFVSTGRPPSVRVDNGRYVVDR